MKLGRQFGWLWAAYGASSFGTWFAFDAFTLVAILVLDASTTQVSVLAAAGLAVGAAVAVPLGPWVDLRRKRPVMIAMDLIRFVALISIPIAYALGGLGFGQLLVVSVLVATADITFRAASGAYLKELVRPEHLLVANGRFESTAWTATMLGPPHGWSGDRNVRTRDDPGRRRGQLPVVGARDPGDRRHRTYTRPHGCTEAARR